MYRSEIVLAPRDRRYHVTVHFYSVCSLIGLSQPHYVHSGNFAELPK